MSVHDFTAAQPDPSAGVAWRGFRSWFRRPPVSTEVPGLFFAGPHTAAGNGLSPTVLAGAPSRVVRGARALPADRREVRPEATGTLRCPFSGDKDHPS